MTRPHRNNNTKIFFEKRVTPTVQDIYCSEQPDMNIFFQTQ